MGLATSKGKLICADSNSNNNNNNSSINESKA